jgi:acyl-CoA thioester hydrolase
MTAGEVRLRVRYAETDQMGVVYHANYLVWMEVGRVELFRSLGVNYRRMEEEDGVLLTVAEASCRFLYPARYDEEIIVRTTVAQSSKRLLRFSYEILAADSLRVLAKGHTTHIFCNRAMRPCQLPERYRGAFGSIDSETTA